MDQSSTTQTPTPTAHAPRGRQAVYAKVTAGILALLEAGVAPWHKPWNPAQGRPRNLVSGRPYSGVNALALGLTGRSPYWLTFRQVNAMGYHLRKGSKGVAIMFCKRSTIEEENAAGEVTERSRFMVRFYHVFNALDVDGLGIPNAQVNEWTPIEAAERILASVRPEPRIMHGGPQASFTPALDVIDMPDRNSFTQPEGYYATLFHELTHWTGHASRLNRPALTAPTKFGDPIYSQEELVAEMGAGFLCALAAIENRTIEQNASYLKSWLNALKGDPGMIVRAAAQAQRAADYLAPTTDDADMDE